MIDQQMQVEETESIKEQVIYYLRYWPWFLFTLITFLSLAFLYLRYTPKIYNTEALMLIKDADESPLSKLTGGSTMFKLKSGVSSAELANIIEVLKSRRLLASVVEDLELNILYLKKGNIKVTEMFTDKLFEVKQLNFNDTLSANRASFEVKIISDEKFDFRLNEDKPFKTYDFGKKVVSKDFEFTLIPNLELIRKMKVLQDEFYLINFVTMETAINTLRGSIQVDQANKNGSILTLSRASENADKSELILNSLVDVYNDDTIRDKNQVSKSTLDFIDNRLAIISRELDTVELGKVDFRRANNITDIETEGSLFLQNSSDLQKEQLKLATQIDLINSLEEYLTSDNVSDLLPETIGDDVGASSGAIKSYNELVLERKRLLQSSTLENPVVVAVDEQIQNLKENVLSNLSNVQKSLNIKNNELIRQRRAIGGQLSKIPIITKDSRSIERQQSIKEQLYLYLLQKREETAIVLAATESKAKIVDYAYTPRSPISPKPTYIYLGALIMSFVLPFSAVYLIQIFDSKVHTRLEIEREIKGSSILGEIPQITGNDNETIQNNDRSVLAESFRILRTNLDYFLRSEDGRQRKTVFVTSTIKGEGKTFVSYNLALSLKSAGKKVLLIGADIRNPQLHRYLDISPKVKGVSEFLYDHTVEIPSLIHKVGDKVKGGSFDLILSGRITPNPAELLLNGRFNTLLDTIVAEYDYDYVLVDTAPTMLVTDTVLISDKADVTVYVVRAEFTDKRLLQFPKELQDDGKLNNVAYVVNNIKQVNFGYGGRYGYGYGYGYGEDSPTLMQRIKRRLG